MEQDPYASPGSSPEAATTTSSMGVRGPYGFFRRNNGLMGILVALLVIDIIATFFCRAFLGSMKISELEGHGHIMPDDLTALDHILLVADLSHASAYILTAILFCIWINRACKNAWLLDAPHMRTTPGWAVGYHFIPILNLWKPYMAMKEIRRASFGNDHKLGKLLPLWWTFWILSMIIGNIAGMLAFSAQSVDEHVMVHKMGFIEMPINVILGGLAIALLTKMTRAQNQRISQWRQ